MIYPSKDPSFQTLLLQEALKARGLYDGELDNWAGAKTAAGLDAFRAEMAGAHGVHEGLASSFADPADVAAFRRCKSQGRSDQACFALGDNGIGKWGDDTTGPEPMCALPPEDWEGLANPRGARVLVTANGRSVICELRDTMPRKANVKNGAIIDLNPGAAYALGLRPPFLVPVTWQWA